MFSIHKISHNVATRYSSEVIYAFLKKFLNNYNRMQNNRLYLNKESCQNFLEKMGKNLLQLLVNKHNISV